MSSYNPPNIRSNTFNTSYNLTKTGIDSNVNTLTDKEKYDLLTMYKEFQLTKNNSSGKVYFKGKYTSMTESIKLDNIECIMYNKGFYFKPINYSFNGILIIESYGSSISIFNYKNNFFNKLTYYEVFIGTTASSSTMCKIYIYDEINTQHYIITYFKGSVETARNIVTGEILYDNMLIIEKII
jgi:hypothetical protein